MTKNKIKPGGVAFPYVIAGQEGISVRQYYLAHIMPACLLTRPIGTSLFETAALAVAYADSLIIEEEKVFGKDID